MVIDDEIAGLITYPDSLLSKESKNCFPYIYILSFHWLTVARSVDKLDPTSYYKDCSVFLRLNGIIPSFLVADLSIYYYR